MFFERVGVETGKWGVDRYATGHGPEHMVNPFIKIGGNMCMTKICCENGVFL